MLNTRVNAHGLVSRLATLLCCSAMLLFATNGFSQLAGTGNIQGTVADSTGAVIPNAAIALTDQATLVKRTATSNTAGGYLFPGIPVSTYNLQVSAPGFKTSLQTGIVLEVGSNIAVNASLLRPALRPLHPRCKPRTPRSS